MANTLKFKRGLVATIPTAALGEPLFTTDTFDLYIGNGTGNTKFQKFIASGTTSQLLRGDGSLLTMPIVLTSPANGEVLKYNGTNWVNSNDAGITGSGVAGQVAYFTGATTQGGSNNLFWNNTSVRLGIGTNTPQAMLDVTQGIRVNSAGTVTSSFANGLNMGTWDAIGYNAAGNTVVIGGYRASQWAAIGFYTNGTEVARINSGNFIINNASTDNGLRFQVTGDGFFSGAVGIGATSLTGYTIRIGRTMTGSTSVYGIANYGVIQSGVTSLATYYDSYASTQSANFGLTEIRHYNVSSSGTFANVTAGGSVSSQFGFYVDSSITGATNNYGFFGNIPSGTGRWNLYMNGTAANYINGVLGLGVLPSAWGSNSKPLQMADASIWGSSALTGYASVGGNYYYDGNYRYIKSSTATDYYQYAGEHVWRNAVSGTAGNVITFVPRMTLDASGNLGLGTNIPKARVHTLINGSTSVGITGTTLIGQNSSSGNSSYLTLVGAYDAEAGIVFTDESEGYRGRIVYSNNNEFMSFWTDLSERMRIFSDGNVGIGTTTNATYKLDVNGTMRVSGAATFSSSVGVGVTPSVDLHVEKTSSPTFRIARTGGTILNISSSITATGAQISTGSASPIGFGINGVIAMTLDTSGNLGIATTPSYKLDVAGEARVSNAIAIGTTPDTNKPFKILKNINGTVGINFENTSTGSSAFSAIQMGTDVSGGTAFTNLVYSSSGVTASGVYQPSGTSLINTGSGGLNFLSVSQPIRFFTSTGNGTERMRITNDGDITHYNGTSPSASTTDAYRMYSADVVAGNAAPHFRTENGAVIKLYQETTAVGNAIFSQGGGNSVLDDSTFDGYTLRQIVKALRNQGILQ